MADHQNITESLGTRIMTEAMAVQMTAKMMKAMDFLKVNTIKTSTRMMTMTREWAKTRVMMKRCDQKTQNPYNSQMQTRGWTNFLTRKSELQTQWRPFNL